MTKTVSLGSANPLTVTNLGGGTKKWPLFIWKSARVKIVKKHILQSAEHINDEDSRPNFRSGYLPDSN